MNRKLGADERLENVNLQNASLPPSVAPGKYILALMFIKKKSFEVEYEMVLNVDIQKHDVLKILIFYFINFGFCIQQINIYCVQIASSIDI